MTREKLLEKYQGLSVAARRQVDRLVAALAATPQAKSPRSAKALDRAFIGLWADRPDMTDAGAWVRSIRDRQWSRRVARPDH
jgi:hypothetical protein